MKKLIVSIALMAVAGGAFAQKSNVNRAYNKVKSENPNFFEARDLVNPALTHEDTKNWSKTWYTAGLAQYGIFDGEWKKKQLGQDFKPDVLYGSLAQCYDYFLKTAEVDQIPNEKGKVKPKYEKEVKDYLATCRNFFIDAGNYYLEQKNFEQAEKTFEKYIQYPDLDINKADNIAKDTLYNTIVVYAGYSAYSAQMHEKAIAYMESVIDQPIADNDKQLVYDILTDEYSKSNQLDKLKALALKGVELFKDNKQTVLNYYQILINQALAGETQNVDEAISYLDKAIQIDENIAPLWELKGQLLEQKGDLDGALTNYLKTVEIDPTLGTAYANIGRIYYNKAAQTQEEAAKLEGDAYNKAMEKANPFFEKALPYFEKTRELDPENQDVLKALRLIYYNLNMGAKYEELNKILGEE